jgi:hypothetical protein
MTSEEIEKRQRVMKNLVNEITQYFKVFAMPIPQRIAAGKYNRAMQPFGGFRQLVTELVEEGEIKKLMNADGSTFLAPKEMEGEVWEGAFKV